MRRYKILVLDDDETIGISLKMFLEDSGWQAETAESAESALELLSRERFDGVIVDLRLPGMDGLSFIQYAAERYPDLIHVIYTGSTDIEIPDDIRRNRRVADQIYIKPVDDVRILLDAIDSLIVR